MPEGPLHGQGVRELRSEDVDQIRPEIRKDLRKPLLQHRIIPFRALQILPKAIKPDLSARLRSLPRRLQACCCLPLSRRLLPFRRPALPGRQRIQPPLFGDLRPGKRIHRKTDAKLHLLRSLSVPVFRQKTVQRAGDPAFPHAAFQPKRLSHGRRTDIQKPQNPHFLFPFRLPSV